MRGQQWVTDGACVLLADSLKLETLPSIVTARCTVDLGCCTANIALPMPPAGPLRDRN
jgi:hypothetical protein